ncbi:MAG: nucleotide exchange factor GrpE [Thermoguttaceae bacterium]|jgi:molecular chaperone GrpE
MANDRADQDPETGADARTPEEDNLLDQLRADLEEAKDRVLRSQAELDNYRKRAAREIDEHRRFANLPLLRDLLPVLDNLERAIAAAETAQDVAGLLEGVKLVDKQFEDVLTRHHCVRIPTLHQPFDPNLHHAICQQPTDEFPPDTVVLVSQPGFLLHDRVVRPSQVIVSTSKEAVEPAD